jgi:hypothetical protein
VLSLGLGTGMLATRIAMGLERGSWSWGISCILIPCARPRLLLPSHLPHPLHLFHCTRLLHRAMLPLTWASPGKLVASLDKTLLSSPMGPCVARLPRSCSRMSNAQKPMAACAWSMAPAFAVVVPVRCESLVNGMAVRRQNHARSACCCIRSRWVPRRSSGGIGAGESIGAPVSNSCGTNASR